MARHINSLNCSCASVIDSCAFAPARLCSFLHIHGHEFLQTISSTLSAVGVSLDNHVHARSAPDSGAFALSLALSPLQPLRNLPAPAALFISPALVNSI
eukprot:52593-Pleurochrysis_carterae.AAC.2